MGERFYLAQIKARGSCPGYNETQRRKKVAWTDEKRALVIEKYTEANPTPETSMDIVKEIAEEVGESPNGVRMVLSKAEVYVKTDSKPTATKKETASGGTRVNKAASHEALASAISKVGGKVDEEIISKLTGKAAVYFTEVLNSIK